MKVHLAHETSYYIHLNIDIIQHIKHRFDLRVFRVMLQTWQSVFHPT